MSKSAPRNGYSAFAQPRGITTAAIDPTTGLLATEDCPVIITEVFREGTVPEQLCDEHQSYWEQEIAEAMEARDVEEAFEEGIGGVEEAAGTIGEDRRGRGRHPFKSWLRKVFGNGNKEGERQGNEDGGGEGKPPG
jgi:hypothetical protein